MKEKQCQNSAKTVPNRPYLPVFTRIYPYSLVCSTPLGSPWWGLKRSYVHVPVVGSRGVPVGVSGCTGPWVYQGGYTGWVYRVGTGGYYTGYYPAARGGPISQRSGPRKSQWGLEWVGIWDRAHMGPEKPHKTVIFWCPVRPSSPDHPLRPGGPTGPASLSGLPSPSKGARFDLNSTEVSQNSEVSPKYV